MSDSIANSPPEITPEIIAEHGLNDAEYDRLLAAMGRTPNMVELGIFSMRIRIYR